VFRVNCMDCLDRTNVIESVYAREVLQTVVRSYTTTVIIVTTVPRGRTQSYTHDDIQCVPFEGSNPVYLDWIGMGLHECGNVHVYVLIMPYSLENLVCRFGSVPLNPSTIYS
jgi:hypothetical protein